MLLKVNEMKCYPNGRPFAYKHFIKKEIDLRDGLIETTLGY
jgi:hypothetical protein